MSRVAIKGNASGTGVFTLEAPNSNTDRALVLPDAGGQVHTSESSNDHASMPTVNGDPIVESGSNSDGEWTRWADGTQICSTAISKDHPNGTSVDGVYISEVVDTPLPASFVEQPRTSVGYFNSSNGFWVQARTSASPPYDWISQAFRATSFTVGGVGTVDLTATGRWK